MDVTASDVRQVRFGTTRLKAGYDISEVDEFLDRVEKSITAYSINCQQAQDEAEALRSQIQQVQSRLESLQGELEQARALSDAVGASPERDTIVVDVPDVETTAENPILVPASGGAELSNETVEQFRRIRDEVRTMLERQLDLVDSVKLPGSGD
ncbi:MAG TPA: DivIVA domain-containing protein [Candidatus Nanopelagicales bacterium]|nr:DivIVA domain-containing protein [Candidatus Nanopelagicales bacterium]